MTPIKLIKDLDFGSKINAHDAVTESGKAMLSKYRGFCYNNQATCGLVNNFITETRNNYSFDSGLMSILESVEQYISENTIRWKLGSVCEAIGANNATFNVLNKKGIQKVAKLVEMSESDVVSYIKAGILKDIQFIPEVRTVCREVYGAQAVEEAARHNTLTYNLSVPVSFVKVNESDDSQIVNVNGIVYKINESTIEVLENGCDDELFNRINSHIHNMTLIGESLVYAYYTGLTNSEQHKFTINEDNVVFTNGRITETFYDVQKLREFVYSDSFAKAMNMNEARKFAQIGTAIADVFENIENVCVLDNVKVFNCNNGATVAVIEGKEQMCVTLFNSFGHINENNVYSTAKEAVTEMKNNYSLDVERLYTKRISEDITSKKQVDVDYSDEVNIRLMKIAGELTEQCKNDPVKLAILDEIANELRKMKG